MLTKFYQRIQFIPSNICYLKHIIQTFLLKLLLENSVQTIFFKSCLNPATSKAKGHITYQNTDLSANNQQLQQS